MKVKGIGAKAYEQMAGFLVIPEGENVLDNTIIHPESYHIAKEILETVGFTVEELSKKVTGAREQLKNFKAEKFA